MSKILAILFIFSFQILFAEPPFVIGIAGGTGSGKTTLANKLLSSLSPYVVLIEQDCYYRDLSHLSIEERQKTNFDNPDSIDFDSFYQDILSLKEGRTIAKPTYSFSTHTRLPDVTEVSSRDIIIIEGILVFTDERLRDLFDLKIFVHTDDDVRILRRIERDINERGRDFESVHKQYLATVKPMHNQFVEPSKQYADVIIPGHTDTSTAVNLILDGLKKGKRRLHGMQY